MRKTVGDLWNAPWLASSAGLGDTQERGRVLNAIVLTSMLLNVLSITADLISPDFKNRLFFIIGSILVFFPLSVSYILSRKGYVVTAAVILTVISNCTLFTFTLISTEYPLEPFLQAITLVFAGIFLPKRWVWPHFLLVLGSGIWLYTTGIENPQFVQLRANQAFIVYTILSLVLLLLGITIFVRLQDRLLTTANIQLTRRNQERGILLARLETVREQELQDIACDIHDGPLQDLIYFRVALEELTDTLSDPLVSQYISKLSQRIGDSTRKTRLLLQVIRPIMVYTNLDTALAAIQERSMILQPLLHLQTVVKVTQSLDGDQIALICRLIQEALANVHKHARATEAHISIRDNAKSIHLRITDNGVGFNTAIVPQTALQTGHIGLASLRERVHRVGGQLTISSAVGQGTSIHCRIPNQPITEWPDVSLMHSPDQ